MTNITQFIELHERRTLMRATFYEIFQWLTQHLEVDRIVKVVMLAVLGWLVSVLLVILLAGLPLTARKPNKEIFFAALNEKIRKNFKHQTEETYQTIIVGTNRVLKTNHEEPTVFLILAPRGAMPTAVRLVTLLVHCILVAYQLPANMSHVERLISDGTKYTAYDDEWPLFYQVRRHLKFCGVAAVLAFECLHPQVVKTLQLLLPQVNSPNPELCFSQS